MNALSLPKFLIQGALCLLVACLLICTVAKDEAAATGADSWNAYPRIYLDSDDSSLANGVFFHVIVGDAFDSRNTRLTAEIVDDWGNGAIWDSVNLYSQASPYAFEGMYKVSYELTSGVMSDYEFHTGTYTIRATVEYFNEHQNAWLETDRPLDEKTVYITEEGRFADVNGDTAHAEDIQWLAEQGITTGWSYSDGSTWFKPYAEIKRADMAAFLYRMAGLDKYKSTVETAFSDVDESTSHSNEVLWLAEQGISAGWTEADGSKSFRPYENVKRADMAAFLYRFAGSPAYEPAGSSAFVDVSEGTPHYKEILWLADMGISQGWTEPDGSRTFRPYDDIKRADMAAFLHRLYYSGLMNYSDQLITDTDEMQVYKVWATSDSLVFEGSHNGWGSFNIEVLNDNREIHEYVDSGYGSDPYIYEIVSVTKGKMYYILTEQDEGNLDLTWTGTNGRSS